MFHSNRAFWVILALGTLAAFLCPCVVLAQEVRAWVDKDEATLGDQIVLTVSISGGDAPPEGPILPSLPEFHVTEGGSSSRIEIVNFRKSSSKEYTYFLVPKRTGVFTIGPVRVSMEGQTRESLPVRVKVLPGDQSPEERPAVFITQEVDVKDPYVHQQVLYTFRFFQQARVVEAQWEPPDFEGFWVEELGKERQFETVLGGQRYVVTEVRKALNPTAAGASEIPACSLTCKLVQERKRPSGRRGMFDDDFFSGSLFGGFGQTVAKVLQAPAIPLNVRPLPTDGQPPGFHGLVGDFEIRADLSNRELRRGDSTTLTVTVEGNGNLRDLVSVGPEEIPGFKIYPDKPSLDIRTEGNAVVSTRVFKKALVPIEEGNLEVPAMQISFFDPRKGTYRTAGTDSIGIAVAPGDQAESTPLIGAPFLPGAKAKIQVLGQDILPVHKGLSATRSRAPLGNGLVPYALAALIPPLVYFVFLVVKKRRDRLVLDPHLVRRKEARTKANRQIKEARKHMEKHEDKEFCNLLCRSIKGIIGDKLNLSALAFTPSEVRKCLDAKGLPEDAVQAIHGFLEEMEYRQYVSSSDDPGDRESLLRKAREHVALLDRKL